MTNGFQSRSIRRTPSRKLLVPGLRHCFDLASDICNRPESGFDTAEPALQMPADLPPQLHAPRATVLHHSALDMRPAPYSQRWNSEHRTTCDHPHLRKVTFHHPSIDLACYADFCVSCSQEL